MLRVARTICMSRSRIAVAAMIDMGSLNEDATCMMRLADLVVRKSI